MKILETSRITAAVAAVLFFVAGGLWAAEPAADLPGPDWRAAVSDFAAGHFKHPAWGYSHAARMYRLGRELALADKAAYDDEVLYAAAYLHDMAAFPPWALEKADHAEEGARIVGTVLEKTGFPMAKLGAVQDAIRTHMYYGKPSSRPEALYLHDADALDWLGAIGAARVLSLVDPAGGAPDGPAAVKMLENSLSAVPASVFSKAGRALVPARKTQLEKFLKDLRSESDGLKTL
jgi:HD superfamily phosphodiesterase